MTMNSTACEREFTFILSSRNELSETVENALFEAGCDDATLSARDGYISMEFSRSGTSLEDAVASAIHEVKKANMGAEVWRVEK